MGIFSKIFKKNKKSEKNTSSDKKAKASYRNEMINDNDDDLVIRDYMLDDKEVKKNLYDDWMEKNLEDKKRISSNFQNTRQIKNDVPEDSFLKKIPMEVFGERKVFSSYHYKSSEPEVEESLIGNKEDFINSFEEKKDIQEEEQISNFTEIQHPNELNNSTQKKYEDDIKYINDIKTKIENLKKDTNNKFNDINDIYKNNRNFDINDSFSKEELANYKLKKELELEQQEEEYLTQNQQEEEFVEENDQDYYVEQEEYQQGNEQEVNPVDEYLEEEQQEEQFTTIKYFEENNDNPKNEQFNELIDDFVTDAEKRDFSTKEHIKYSKTTQINFWDDPKNSMDDDEVALSNQFYDEMDNEIIIWDEPKIDNTREIKIHNNQSDYEEDIVINNKEFNGHIKTTNISKTKQINLYSPNNSNNLLDEELEDENLTEEEKEVLKLTLLHREKCKRNYYKNIEYLTKYIDENLENNPDFKSVPINFKLSETFLKVAAINVKDANEIIFDNDIYFQHKNIESVLENIKRVKNDNSHIGLIGESLFYKMLTATNDKDKNFVKNIKFYKNLFPKIDHSCLKNKDKFINNVSIAWHGLDNNNFNDCDFTISFKEKKIGKNDKIINNSNTCNIEIKTTWKEFNKSKKDSINFSIDQFKKYIENKNWTLVKIYNVNYDIQNNKIVNKNYLENKDNDVVIVIFEKAEFINYIYNKLIKKEENEDTQL